MKLPGSSHQVTIYRTKVGSKGKQGYALASGLGRLVPVQAEDRKALAAPSNIIWKQNLNNFEKP